MVTMMKRTVRLEDALGRTVRVERGGFGGATLATAYAYDGLGRLVRVAADGEPAVSYAYGAAGERVSATRSVGPEWRRTTVGWNAATGRIVSMRVSGCGDEFRWTYLPGTDLKSTLRYPNGDLVTWEYERHRNLVNLVSNDTYSTFAYGCDALGRRTAKNDERYFHNVRGELVLATNVATGAEFAYRYDDIGNRIWSRELGTNCTYAANELNQYTDVVRGGVAEHLAFDPDGNQTNVVTGTGVWAVEYNGENRPVRWTRLSDGNSISMAYDRMGRRISKNGETFVYDGYLNVGNTVWDPTEPVATRPLVSCGDDGTRAFFFHDANKNVTELVNAQTGSTAAHYDYSAFGRTLVAAGPLAHSNPFRFSSEYVDDATGLTYYNYRHYDPVHGRWLNFDQMDIKSEILYVFCYNKPERIFDFKGWAAAKWGDDPQFGGEKYRLSPFLPYIGEKDLFEEPYKSILIDDVASLIRELQGISDEYQKHCPCQIDDAHETDGWSSPQPTRHEGGDKEIRREWNEHWWGMPYPMGQQCVYDKCGKLINKGSAAGTPDKIHYDDNGDILQKAFHCILDGGAFAVGSIIDKLVSLAMSNPDIATRLDHWWAPPDSGLDPYGNPCPDNDGK